MHCPSCGHEVEADRRFGHLAVCSACRSALVLDERAARVSGRMAVLARAASPFYVGASGSLRDRRFRVLGRVRYGYGRGLWDEWYLVLDDDQTMWISEDEGTLTLEVLTEIDETIDHARAEPGDRVRIGTETFVIDERDVATCEGGEGQLPFEVRSGATTPFLDLSSDARFATIEYDPDGMARAFVGTRLDPDDLVFDHTAADAGVEDTLSAERAAGDGIRERIVKQAGREVDIKCFACAAPLPPPEAGAAALTCTYCNAVLDLRLDRVTCPDCGVGIPLQGGHCSRTVVCTHCRASVDVSRHDAPAVLEALARVKRPSVPFRLGQAGRFDGVDYRIIGHIRFVERDAWGVYRSDEFMLFNAAAGYRWLIVEDGHISLSEELDERPAFDMRHAPRKTSFRFDGRRWRVFESGKTTVEYVDGELPWVARIGDANHYTDAIAPPDMLSMEWSTAEAEWFRARYLHPDEVAAAFGVEEATLPQRVGVAPHQPFTRSGVFMQGVGLFGLFAVIYAVLLGQAWLRPGDDVANIAMPTDAYGAEYLTKPFDIAADDSLCRVEFAAGVDNSWVYTDVAVIDEHDRALLDFSAEMSYYHGYEGRESWSEGSHTDARTFKLERAGRYRLLLLAQTGTGDQPVDTTTGPPLHIRVLEGAQLKRFYATGLVICGLAAFVGVVRRGAFEAARWGDDDDD